MFIIFIFTLDFRVVFKIIAFKNREVKVCQTCFFNIPQVGEEFQLPNF